MFFFFFFCESGEDVRFCRQALDMAIFYPISYKFDQAFPFELHDRLETMPLVFSYFIIRVPCQKVCVHTRNRLHRVGSKSKPALAHVLRWTFYKLAK